MSVDFYNIFKQKTGMAHVDDSWEDTQIDEYLDQAAFIVSMNYATPWSGFSSVPSKYKYAVTLLAAIEYWWSKVSEYVGKFDIQIGQGSGMSQKSETQFARALRMIESLQEEVNDLDLVSEGSGDIVVGDIVRRSKFTGLLYPRADDSAGNWLS